MIRDNIWTLTPREKQVADLIVRGYTNPQIAGELTITRETVKSHVSNVLEKLGVRSRYDVRKVYGKVNNEQRNRSIYQ